MSLHQALQLYHQTFFPHSHQCFPNPQTIYSKNAKFMKHMNSLFSSYLRNMTSMVHIHWHSWFCVYMYLSKFIPKILREQIFLPLRKWPLNMDRPLKKWGKFLLRIRCCTLLMCLKMLVPMQEELIQSDH